MASFKSSGGGGGGGVANGGPMTTRNHRPPLFGEDEKVLCYEPDQKKARVLYDSKVLEVVEKKDTNGKMHYEYKIHFQGWNSSWDRYVREENVLKDTEKNRQLQRELNKAAQLLCRTNVKKKNKRKTILEKLRAANQTREGSKSKNGSFRPGDNLSCSFVNGNGFFEGDTKDGSEADQLSSDEEEFAHRPPVTIEVPPNLKTVLEHDYFYVKEGQKLMRLPTRLTVVELLENYIQYKASEEIEAFTLRRTHQLQNVNGAVSKSAAAARKSGAAAAKGGKISSAKSTSSSSSSSLNGLKSSRSKADLANEDLIKTFARINESKRICEDIRVMFDFLLFQMFLYENEQEQYRHFLRDYFNLIRIPNDDVIDDFFEESTSNCSVASQNSSPDLSNIDPKILMPPPPPPPPSKSSPRYSEPRCSSSVCKHQQQLVKPSEIKKESEETSVDESPPSEGDCGPTETQPSSSQEAPKCKKATGDEGNSRKGAESLPTASSSSAAEDSHQTDGGGGVGESEEPPTKRRKSRNLSEPSSSKGGGEEEPTSEPSSSSGSSSSGAQKVRRRCNLVDRCEYPWACEQLNEFMDELLTYRMLPPEVVVTGEVHPSLSYGAVHLLRLFVSIPEILERTMIHPKKLKIVLCELNRILGYVSTLKDLISHHDWYNPIAKLFEEDSLQQKFPKPPKTSSSLSLSSSSSSEGATTRRQNEEPSVAPRKGRARRAAAPVAPPSPQDSSLSEITIKIDLSTVKEEAKEGPNPVLQVDGGRHFDRRVKRNPPRASGGTGKQSAEPTIIEGHALGVRKSLSVEELSRETLVAPSCSQSSSTSVETPKKAYSLRMHRRVPYKT